MKKVILVGLVLCTLVVCRAAPADNKDTTKDVQSAFVPAFDEIVVESSLTVRRKTDGSRQGRNKNTPKTVTIIPFPSTIAPSTSRAIRRTKRQFTGFSGFAGFNRPSPGFSTSVANAHAQANNVNTPFGSFGSSASHSQNQAWAAGPYGLTSPVGLSATQHYYFSNGMQIDVNFANSGSALNGQTQAGASSSSVNVSNSPGHKCVFYS